MSNFKVWTVYVFLAPLFVAIFFRIWISAIILLVVISISHLYHISNERKYRFLDVIMATILIFSNIVLCSISQFRLKYIVPIIVLSMVAFYFAYFSKRTLKYDISHGIWHIISAIITLLSLFTYFQL